MASDKFPEVGSIAQALKHQIRSGAHWNDLPPAEKESLDQIATSIARIVSNDGAHWDAIMGFAEAARPTPMMPTPVDNRWAQTAAAPTIDIERGIRSLVRELPTTRD